MLLAVLAGTQLLGVLGAVIFPSWVAGTAVIVENLYLKPKTIAEAQSANGALVQPETAETNQKEKELIP
jgi:hypothetical protein